MKVEKSDRTIEGKEVFKIFELESGEYYEGDVLVVEGKARIDGSVDGDVITIDSEIKIEGAIDGDLVTLFSKGSFNGSVSGDFVCISSEMKIIGGNVEGDMVSVASKSTANNVAVEGDKVNVKFPLLSSILKMAKPLVVKKAIKSEEIKEMDELVVKEGESIKWEGVHLKARRVEVRGALKLDSIKEAKEVIVHGTLKCGAISSELLRTSGEVKCGAVNANRVEVLRDGNIWSGAVDCDELLIEEGGRIKAGAVNAKRAKVDGTITSGAFSCDKFEGIGRIKGPFSWRW